MTALYVIEFDDGKLHAGYYSRTRDIPKLYKLNDARRVANAFNKRADFYAKHYPDAKAQRAHVLPVSLWFEEPLLPTARTANDNAPQAQIEGSATAV